MLEFVASIAVVSMSGRQKYAVASVVITAPTTNAAAVVDRN